MSRESTVATVTGEAPIAALGFTLPHEHVIHRTSIHSGNPDNTCVDRELMAAELAIFRGAGGQTICDLTPMGLGRDTSGLREVSERSGVAIISGLRVYQREVWPGEMCGLDGRGLVDFLVRESEGNRTGVPAGLIGENGRPSKSSTPSRTSRHHVFSFAIAMTSSPCAHRTRLRF